MADEPHPQVQELLAMVDQQPIPPTYALSVPEARARMADLFTGMDADPVGDVRNFEIEGPAGPLPVRLYLPEGGERPHPVLVFFHGGGFVLGGLDTHDSVCRALTNAAGCAVLSADYRLAPEHTFPAAVEDAYAATEWAATHGDRVGLDPDRVAVGGDSAGGNLTAATTLVAGDRGGPDLAHQLLIYPAVASPVLGEFDSYAENAEGYFLEVESMSWFVERYVDSEADYRNEYFAPLLARDLSGVPPATIVSAGFDPLRDEAYAYERRLADAGVPVEHAHYEEMIHGFVSMLDMIDRGGEAIELAGERLAAEFE